MSAILEAILQTLPSGWHVRQVYLGTNWTVSLIQNDRGEQRAGLAASPAPAVVAAQNLYRLGPNSPHSDDAFQLAYAARSAEAVRAAIGLATLNALLQPDPALLTSIDAGDWLVEHCPAKNVALVGRFPLKEELRPLARELWILELDPQPGEYPSSAAPALLPQADIIAITGSTLINHTLDGLLALTRPTAQVMLLGPTTPLSPVLFDFGVDLLSGVQVSDLAALLHSVGQGVSFRKLAGVRRVTLVNPRRNFTG